METNIDNTYVAEQSVIGAIILEEKSLSLVIDIIKAEDFYFKELKVCYEAILELSRNGKPIDFVTVLNQITASGSYDKNEMKKLLLGCTEITPSIRNVEHYAKIVANSHKARKLQGIFQSFALDGVNAENADETLDKAMSELFKISANRKAKKLQDIGEVGTKLFESYNEENEHENRCDTGFSRLDGILKGMSTGNLIILAARPKVGKTSFALSVAENVAKSGKTVAFYSLEMQSSEIYERLLAKRAQIPMNTLIDRRFKDKKRPQKIRSEEINKIAETIDDIYKLPIKINDNPACTVNDIRLECRCVAARANPRTKSCGEQNLASREEEPPLGLIIIDYLQLMRGARKCENRNLEVGSICRDLKCLAAELGVPILCLSQLNRTSDETSRPSSSEFRDSGSIEQDANKCILMWCVEKNLNELGQVESKTIGVDVALNRRGRAGFMLFNFNGNFMEFTELDRVYEEQKPANWRRAN